MVTKRRLFYAAEALRMIDNSRTDNPFSTPPASIAWNTAHACARSCVAACDPVDAEEVVYCEHCSKWDTGTVVGSSYLDAMAACLDEASSKGCICKRWSTDTVKHWTKPRDFCSYGDRKENCNE